MSIRYYKTTMKKIELQLPEIISDWEINLILPLPISVNQAYSWFTRRHKSNEYKEWEFRAYQKFLEQKKLKSYEIKWDEWLFVVYKYYMPLFFKNGNKKKQDLFNLEKALSDFLWKHIPWFQDQHIRCWYVEKIDSDRWEVEIIIKEIQ